MMVADQEVPREDGAYEEVANHVSGEDVVDLQTGHAELEVQQMQTEVNVHLLFVCERSLSNTLISSSSSF